MVGGSLVSKDAERIAENSLIHCAFRLKLRVTHLLRYALVARHFIAKLPSRHSRKLTLDKFQNSDGEYGLPVSFSLIV